MWYKDASLATPIENVVGAYGRSQEQGVDLNMKHFGIGLLMGLNAWGSAAKTRAGTKKVTRPKKK